MIDLKPELIEMKEKILNADQRFEILDSQHLVDTMLGIEYHLYDPKLNPGKPYKITSSNTNDVLLIGTQLTGAEADILDDIRNHLYKFFTEQAREQFSKMHKQSLANTPSKMNVKPRQPKI